MSFYYPTRDEEDQILKEIGYSRSQLEKDIPYLRQWLQEQTHLPACRLKENDIFFSNFLVGSKGSIETAKRKLDHYYSLRGKGEVFSNRGTFEYVDSCARYHGLVELPKPTPTGNGILLSRVLDDAKDEYVGINVLRKAALMLEFRIRSVPISGQHIYLLDCHRFNISHFLMIPPNELRTFVSFFQDAYPMRVKKILVTSVPPVLATAVNTVVLPFVSKKLRGRLILTSEPIEKAFEHVELLPNDIEGGKGTPLRELTDAWAESLKSSQLMKDLLPQLQEAADESKRPRITNGINDPYFGLHGSIKTLVLD